MSNLTKTIQTELLGIQTVTAGSNVKSAVLDVSTLFSGTFLLDFAAIATQATPAATEFCIQTSQKNSGNDTWVNMFTWLSSSAQAASLTVSAGGGVAATTITLTPTLGSTNVYFFLKNGTLTNSEWPRRIAISGGGPFVVTVEDGFTNDQSAAVGWNVAERYKYDVDFSSIRRIRVAVNNNRSASVNRDVVVRCALITADSIT
jgi:hypothetical protein